MLGKEEVEEEEELINRADVFFTSNGVEIAFNKVKGLGSRENELDKKIEKDKRRVKWNERKEPEGKVCKICGKEFKSKANRTMYCSEDCRKKGYKKRKIRYHLKQYNRQAHLGWYGELWVITKKGTLTFIPALYNQSEEECYEWIEKRFKDKNKEYIFTQLEDYFKGKEGIIK